MIRRIIILVFFGLCLIPPAKAFASKSVLLPMKVKIIGFEDTKKICSQKDFPSWCPAHLRPYESAEVYGYEYEGQKNGKVSGTKAK